MLSCIGRLSSCSMATAAAAGSSSSSSPPSMAPLASLIRQAEFQRLLCIHNTIQGRDRQSVTVIKTQKVLYTKMPKMDYSPARNSRTLRQAFLGICNEGFLAQFSPEFLLMRLMNCSQQAVQCFQCPPIAMCCDATALVAEVSS